MNGMKSVDPNTLSVQIKSLMIFEFLNEYNRLEQAIRTAFEQSIPILPQKVVQQLYFYNGGRVATFIDSESESVKLNVVNYKENDLFKELKINQIIKIFKNTPCLESFNFAVASIQRATTEFSFYDCVVRLINMRNKLAHEMVKLQFKNQDLIELLTFEQLEEQSFEILQNFDIRKMDDMTQYIASNIVYMRKLLTTLDSSESE